MKKDTIQDEYLNEKELIGKNEKKSTIITKEIIKIVFPTFFNDGRHKRGRVGICMCGDIGGWYINTVQHFVGKHIKTIDQLDRFLKKEGVPFDFTSIKNKNNYNNKIDS